MNKNIDVALTVIRSAVDELMKSQRLSHRDMARRLNIVALSIELEFDQLYNSVNDVEREAKS